MLTSSRFLLTIFSMKYTYREKMGLLTSHQIVAIRAKNMVLVKVICVSCFDWAQKLIHAMKVIKYRTLPTIQSFVIWIPLPSGFLLLHAEKESLSPISYVKYKETGTVLF